ncbi:hypothetical protein CLV30_12818 [Haloactinopolyspora alba]|uniref:Uncharacterized protein n=2 Tax=Haloactinopolyspora alba TaxID=648780 RepID=A0A2P8DEW3_9ACTN|nr:hypothetical protein CLV30_12818 [Haloactinopolyspora alba]
MLVEADLHERYGIDVDSPLMEQRTWRWLRSRILALLGTPESRVSRALNPPKHVPHRR